MKAGQYQIKRAESLAEVEVAAWLVAAAVRESYREIVSPAVLEAMTSNDYVIPRIHSWWRATVDGAHIWLAKRSSDLKAVATAYADASDDPEAPTALELRILFALDEAKGSGLADALLHAAIGDSPAFLWTLSGNDRAIGFYRKHGFRLDGASRTSFHLTAGRDGVAAPTEVRLVRLN
ncbi:MAG: GNAT family N-acetyltransferase [Brooklawnia sp.]